MSADLDLTLAAVRNHGFRAILLQPRSKEPTARNGTHWSTTEAEEIRRHVEAGGNVGLYADPHVVLDFDFKKGGCLADMVLAEGLTPILPTVETGSGKWHVYLVASTNLPASIRWRGDVAGQILRLPTQYVVAPPSVHPDTGRPYVWLTDPSAPLPALPEDWTAFLHNTTAPSPASATWSGPSAEELLRRALRQPGARHRSNGVKFQCPGCRAEGHDRHHDNATVFNDGRWGCALDESHRQQIGVALGVVPPEARPRPLLGLQGLRGI